MSISKSHNLNIQMYSFQELLNLFELSNKITEDDIKRCKRTVLMTHPDKSKLGPEYFLFYKKAFDVVLEFYKTQTKTSQDVTKENTQYTAFGTKTNKQAHTNINKMESKLFNSKFNQLFDDNMASHLRPNPDQNQWFSQDDAQYSIPEEKNINKAFEQIKQQSNGLVMYKGIQNLNSTTGITTGNLYDDEDEDRSQYVTSDPFSKLKYDDLRKVHKDQTVFAVSERDFEKVQKYSSVEHFQRERNQGNMDPLGKVDAENMLKTQEKQMTEHMMKREYNAKLQSMTFVEKNKNVLASFLHLEN